VYSVRRNLLNVLLQKLYFLNSIVNPLYDENLKPYRPLKVLAQGDEPLEVLVKAKYGMRSIDGDKGLRSSRIQRGDEHIHSPYFPHYFWIQTEEGSVGNQGNSLFRKGLLEETDNPS